MNARWTIERDIMKFVMASTPGCDQMVAGAGPAKNWLKSCDESIGLKAEVIGPCQGSVSNIARMRSCSN